MGIGFTEKINDFFNRVWLTIKNDWLFPWEQDIINDLHESGEFVINVKPMRAFNSWWLDTPKEQPEQFVIHYMARTLEDKVKIFKELSKKIKI